MSSRFIVQDRDRYLLWAAATGHEVRILINGADVGLSCRSDLGPFSDPKVEGERELSEGDVVTTAPGNARLIVRRLADGRKVYDSAA